MKKLSDNFLSIILLLILAISPVQTAIASTTHSMMANATYQEMLVENDVAIDDKAITDISMQAEHCEGHKTDHCKGDQASQCKCNSTHCTTTSLILLPVYDQNSFALNHINFKRNSDSSTYQSTLSSLYRPPRV